MDRTHLFDSNVVAAIEILRFSRRPTALESVKADRETRYWLQQLTVPMLWRFRSLRCDRTRMHLNLFIAISIHAGLLLVVHVDKYIANTLGEAVGGAVVAAHGTIYETVRWQGRNT